MLLIFRLNMFIPMAITYLIVTILIPAGAIAYESQWGFGITCLSLISSILAKDSRWWHTVAVYTSEISMVFNICIVPIFWGLIWPIYYAHWELFWSTYAGRLVLFELFYIHSTPLFCSIV